MSSAVNEKFFFKKILSGVLFLILIAGIYLNQQLSTENIKTTSPVPFQIKQGNTQPLLAKYETTVSKKRHIKKTIVKTDIEPLPLEVLSKKFQAVVKENGYASNIRVETKNPNKRGYVAFMPGHESFNQGIEGGIAEMAQTYLDTFSSAPSVTFSLIINGGVKSQITFLRDGGNYAVRAGENY